MALPPDHDPLQDTYDPLKPSPIERRVFNGRDAFSLWFSLGIGLLVLQAGSFLVPGLSLGTALAAIVIGSAMGACLLGLAGVVGADTGLSTISALRPTLGVRGASVPALLNILQLIGWGSFEIVAMRDAASTLSQNSLGASLPIIWTLVFGVAATGLAFLGPLSFVRRFLRSWGIYLLLIGAVWMTWSLLSTHDIPPLFARKGEGGMHFGNAIDLVAAMPLSWLPLIADYSRFGKSPSAMFKGSTLGYLIANIWFFGLGAAYTLIAADEPQGMLLSALAITGGGLALLLILIDETDNIFADIFSAAMSTGTLVKVKIGHLVVGFGVLCTLIAIFVPMAKYEIFLITIGSVFTPLYGVMLVDHFIVRKRSVKAEDIDLENGAYWFESGMHVNGFLAWGLGVGVYYAVMNFAPGFSATFPAFIASGVAYLALKNKPNAT